MKIYLVEQSVEYGYDTYDSFVVICDNEEEARLTHPIGWFDDGRHCTLEAERMSWASIEDKDKIKVTYLGEAKEGSKKEVVCASFNAG